MSDYHKQVCVKAETDTQYESIKPLLEEFVRNKISFDIFIPKLDQNVNSVNEMYDKTHATIEKDGFRNNVIRRVLPDKRYHVALLAPHYHEGINAKYYIKYSYGSINSSKPKLTHAAHMLNHYHAYLLCNTRDAEIFNVFCKTYILPDLKHVGYVRADRPKSNKQTILFLPSWENQNNLEWIAITIEKLKRKYRTIVKLHPFGDYGTEISDSTKQIKQQIRALADEYYEGGSSMDKLLSRSDLIISDISGAVFDACM